MIRILTLARGPSSPMPGRMSSMLQSWMGGRCAPGAVASLKHVKNPISLARLVMEKSPHVMMDGAGAETFATQMGVELVDQKYFYTEERCNPCKS